MTWHIFVLVWGDTFLQRFATLPVAFQAMAGNLPALARDGPVTYHVYTDTESKPALVEAFRPLEPWCALDIRLFDDSEARGLSGPEYKYALQRACVRDLGSRVSEGEPIVLLDSNFVLANGTLGALARRLRQGYRVATVSVLRVAFEPFAASIAPVLASGAAVASRDLLRAGLPTMHHITRSFFIDAEPFTPYPSQLSRWVNQDGFVNRNILPHPLMISSSTAIARSQSTMDYDLALRAANDAEIHVCCDSDEMLVVKFSDDEHQSARIGESSAITPNIGTFLLSSTNRRHHLFASAPVVFHAGDLDARYRAASAELRALLDSAYAWIDEIAARPSKLDARGLMFLKSHLGPIEDFMSPQLEPAALARLT